MRRKIAKRAVQGIALCVSIISLFFNILTAERILREWKHRQNCRYNIRHSYTISFDNYKETYLIIIADTDKYNADELLTEIREQEEQRNGKSDKLKIEIYKSQENLKADVCEKEYVYSR